MTSGRSGTGEWRYRRNRATLLATSDLCALCGHPGATTADHIVPPLQWRQLFPDNPEGYDELANLQPAHGSMGSGRVRGNAGRCPTCGLNCNQVKSAKEPKRRPQSRQWLRR